MKRQPNRSGNALYGLDNNVRRTVMFRFVGWLVVTGFALYGATQFVSKHVVTEKAKES